LQKNVAVLLKSYEEFQDNYFELRAPALFSFQSCEKIHERNNLEEGKIYIGSGFERFQSVIGWPIIVGL
jgi:hypothetical protein